MAKPARGLPADFSLNLPDEKPVKLGDFLDEELPVPRKARRPHVQVVPEPPANRKMVRQEAGEARVEEGRGSVSPRPVLRSSQPPNIIRYQLNLTPKSKRMLEELVQYVCTYSPEPDARTSEVFQGIITLLHNAMDELELSDLPRRGAWGSVTAKNFPGALSEIFERAILKAAQKRGVLA